MVKVAKHNGTTNVFGAFLVLEPIKNPPFQTVELSIAHEALQSRWKGTMTYQPLQEKVPLSGISVLVFGYPADGSERASLPVPEIP
jgi:hypothetical protein